MIHSPFSHLASALLHRLSLTSTSSRALAIDATKPTRRPLHPRWTLQTRRVFSSSHTPTMAPKPTESDPLLARLPSPVAAPPVLLQPGAEQIVAPAKLSNTQTCQRLDFIQPHLSTSKRKRPQCIAHRGYKAKHPENTMSAFRAAVAAGAHAVETDLHMTKDDVVVLSHDMNLKRCFGRDEKIADKTWDEIKDVRTIQEPHERMPRLADLLTFLAEEGNERIWVFLDIKLDNDAERIMRLIASTLSSVSSQPPAPWSKRVVLGLWAAKYLPPAQEQLPGYPIMHIAFSTTYARQFFEVENVGFNMMFYALLMPGGRSWLREAQEVYKRKVLSWTINGEDNMKWCIRRGLDGVVTDEVERYMDVANHFDEKIEQEPWLPVGWKVMWSALRAFVWIKILLVFYGRKLK